MPDDMRPSRLWRGMPAEARVAAATAFWSDEQAALEQAEAITTIARQIKFRPKSVIALSVEKKARHLVGLGQVSDLVAARLLVTYHLAEQRPMMSRFLDELGIKHEDGLIAEESPATPEPATLDKAVKALSGAFPQDQVARYLWTLLWQDPETWGGLQDRPELALG
ncbi:MAG: hypothetical protein ACT4QD_16930 [Acidobacteriota bacterium]